MKNKMGLFWVIVSALCITIGGCGFGSPSRNSDTGTKDISDGQEISSGKRNGNSVDFYDIEKYRERLSGERELIADCTGDYQQDIEAVKNTSYRNCSFSDCKFSPMPEFDELYVMAETDHGISTKESWDTIEQWLDDIGESNQVDMDKEVRIVTPEVEWNDALEYPYSYPALSEHMDLTSGGGAFVDTTDCHMQISYDGVYSMSDGKMNRYLGDTTWAHSGALGDYAADVVAQGKVPELSEKSWSLISGNLSIGEGAELVKSYFEAGTPFKPAAGVSLTVSDVSVFSLGDVYGYDYTFQRIYKGVPVSIGGGGYVTYTPGSYGTPDGDIRHAYVVDDTGVSAYHGMNAAAVLTELYKDQAMIGFRQAVQLLSENLAPYINADIHESGFAYVPVSFDEGISTTLFPCWEFSGINRMKKEGIFACIDAFTGDIYYYTFLLEEE